MNKESQLTASPVRHRFLSERGWLNFGVIGGLLVFTTVSGLAVWLLRFSGFSQIVVLLHTLVGAGAAAAFVAWQLSHWLGTRKAPRKPRKVSAYIGFWLLAASVVSGFIVTWQGLFGLYMDHVWSRVHLWTGILAIPFLAYHMIPARDESAPGYGSGRRRMWISACTVSAVLAAVTVLAGAVAGRGGTAPVLATPPGQNPFGPSNASTDTGHPLPFEILANSDSCGVSGCHTAIYEEWRGSAHRWSGQDEFFQTVRSVMTELHGTTVTEKCAACHEPVSLFAGVKDPRLGSRSPGFHEGDSCVVCHAVRKMDERGIGSYTLGTPRPYLYEHSASSAARAVSRFLIRVYPAQHALDYRLDPVRKPESCAPCHKEYDVVIEKQGPVQVETQFDDWKQGKWNTDPDPSQRLVCQQCHMFYKEAAVAGLADPYDARVGLGRKHRNHDFAAANQYMPLALSAPDAEGQVRRVNEWLHGERKVPEIARVWPEGPVMAVNLAVPRDAKPGEESTLAVSLTNRKAGHGFPTGPLNIVRAWIEVIVRDSAGTEIFHSGKLDAENHIEAGSYVLKPIAIDPAGHKIMEPDIWHPNGPQYRPAVEPGKTDTFDYRFRIPRDARGPLSVQARLRYRKANQFFVDSVYPGMHRTLPVTDVSSAQAAIPMAGEGSSGGTR